MLTQGDKDYIGEMLIQQTTTLLEHMDAMKEELKRDIMDSNGRMLEEMGRRIDQHVSSHHA
ncbi:MAG: hypothetical protein A2991_02445 [Candidatus Terrybacteria bacterium RIFCSPLOWO2_01_FULL_58_14]|uniref:Uncharacterized protein n=1 Tax=Candidatus Terrybacteria bacterium RIFCSPLOWO2_01_FULL_58_14 TaxID=1802369 RepID=A0A1G2PY37_9BACT|nr:MAG: hypothetical protein A2991_02445 [Candidatus Terrybacteria bacterium RIFCSPLOWO2_01_FULL_58_14]